MAVYNIQAVKFCEQLTPGPEMYYLSAWDEWINVYFYIWIVRGEGKIILVDTGIREVNEINPSIIKIFGEKGKFRMDMEKENIPRLLHEAGVEPEKVDYVILTHLHYDHCSNLKLFPNATIVVSRKGLAEIAAPRYPFLVPKGVFPEDIIAYLMTEARDRLYLASDEEEVLPGISVFWTGGHTPCSQAVKIQTKKGAVVLTGDVVFLYDNIERNHPVGLSYSIPECLDAMKRIKAEADLIIPAHDPKVLEKYPGGIIA